MAVTYSECWGWDFEGWRSTTWIAGSKHGEVIVFGDWEFKFKETKKGTKSSRKCAPAKFKETNWLILSEGSKFLSFMSLSLNNNILDIVSFRFRFSSQNISKWYVNKLTNSSSDLVWIFFFFLSFISEFVLGLWPRGGMLDNSFETRPFWWYYYMNLNFLNLIGSSLNLFYHKIKQFLVEFNLFGLDGCADNIIKMNQVW